ncbi:hypothetical protein AKJ38_00635 [candidate division MSBL1 archaeon SCGC-AAA259I14]|uniref:Nudix hydrolase domain-containing protein n=1 Tax=candidate division MSBL1 archaeon SCGC-AAA259I14 TaxID=1698268 RepID=A0A133UTU5_9EURY|nr:hypothetical protein AKJ38_00635 [candidate division MSBL1 archaeon SCGC-AAA259I14]
MRKVMKEKIPEIVKKSHRELPHFSDGRVDYSDADKAPTVITFLKHENKFLLLKRSDKVRTYKNKWCVVAGYLDELKPVGEKALEEVKEETGIREDEISEIYSGESFMFEDENKTWISHPVLMELKEKPDVVLDWEHTEYKWVKERDLDKYISYHFLRGLKNLQTL